ncbi:hypothetical protein OIU84_007130 [Salix udensis]|uniref:Polygalacturonase n=1 Tax=Salix udensis TaxID=889485 RepID=A0AAD6JS55_9ROSI|nr:hypothetical protein OIU84_007130 [Salix udensis]
MAKYLLLLLVSILGAATSAPSRSCNQAYSVVDYGAVGDGDTDDTQAFKDAWKDVCKSSSCSPIIQVPGGKTFLLQPLTFNGECKPDQIIFQVDGTITAPSDPNDWNCHGNKYCKQWITFDEVANLVIRGSGTVDGRGSTWWERHSSCKGIGSLGIDGENETVEDVHVSFVVFTETTNGARIKTWQGGKGFARNIVFENIRSEGARNPIIIDQYYCDHKHCTEHSSAVKISNIRYENIYGTSRRKPAVHIACSKAVPCTDILLNNIHLEAVDDDDDDGDEPSAFCSNVQGHAMGHVFPPLRCLS